MRILFPASFRQALFAAAFLFSFPLLAGNGTALLAKAPRYSAMAAGGDFAGALAFCRSLAPQEAEYWENSLNSWAAPFGVKVADVSEFLIVSDDRGNRPAALLRFAEEKKPEELLDINRDRVTSLGGKPEFFTLKNVGRDLRDYAFCILSPGLCFAGEKTRQGGAPKLDVAGAPVSLTELVPQEEFLFFCCGTPRLRQAPLDGIDEFYGTVSRGKGGGKAQAVIRSSDPMRASFLQVSLLAMASMWLQGEVGMTPEEAGAFLRKHLTVRQRGGQLEMRCSHLKNALMEIAAVRVRTMAEESLPQENSAVSEGETKTLLKDGSL